ncbi:chloramphenicol phosphotransferase CPT family protein [Nocardioides cavernaquae]|uniref:Chloramphenicol phosphotransferase n=1 Tax=Nocardioides cavernaquae TaxID=2321396 RepID=A0A3A5HCQ3_9ACTN|nr:AAA family ATPase [Nocardioides cavernaquae]RJS45757.1 chloramphenicol phosphotransferase [Nocardioides cavernaquae]
MTGQVIVLNGGSSSGKSTLAKALQRELAGFWLRLGVDTLIEAAPPRLLDIDGGLELGSDGSITHGPAFAVVEDQWMKGVAAVAAAGGLVIIEDNFVSGPSAQRRWREALGQVPTAWIGVRCPPAVAAERERDRADRVEGMAAKQAESVHRGIHYDLEVDTSVVDAVTIAGAIREHLQLSTAP